MKKIGLLIILITMTVSICSCTKNEKRDENVINNNIVINEKEYNIIYEDNETVKEFFKLFPLELNMKDLNNNEKYAYLNNSLPTNKYSPKHITSGDVMLFQDNCIVIFYKSFDTNYTYTKIGHIDNLDDLDYNSITVKFN